MDSQDDADLLLLGLANEKSKFAIQIGYPFTQEAQEAFERGIDNDWFTLVDISDLANAPNGAVCRIFKLTTQGKRRLDDLRSVR